MTNNNDNPTTEKPATIIETCCKTPMTYTHFPMFASYTGVCPDCGRSTDIHEDHVSVLEYQEGLELSKASDLEP